MCGGADQFPQRGQSLCLAKLLFKKVDLLLEIRLITFHDVDSLHLEIRTTRYCLRKTPQSPVCPISGFLALFPGRRVLTSARKRSYLVARIVEIVSPTVIEATYGSDTLEIHADAIPSGAKVLVVDDLLATGGTIDACCKLVEQAGGVVVGCSFLIELAELDGASRIAKYKTVSLVKC